MRQILTNLVGNATNRFVMREQFKSWGCRYGEAPSGPQALDRLRAVSIAQDPYDIAIVDMQMPEMAGEELGQRIKRDPELQNTILVLMTSMGNRGDAIRFRKLGYARVSCPTSGWPWTAIAAMNRIVR